MSWGRWWPRLPFGLWTNLPNWQQSLGLAIFTILISDNVFVVYLGGSFTFLAIFVIRIFKILNNQTFRISSLQRNDLWFMCFGGVVPVPGLRHPGHCRWVKKGLRSFQMWNNSSLKIPLLFFAIVLMPFPPPEQLKMQKVIYKTAVTHE